VIKKTITFEDLDGNTVTEDFYFHITKAELMEKQFGTQGGFDTYLRRILSTDDQGKIFSTFREIIGMSVGRRSPDGRSFLKTPEITAEFMGTEAYSELLSELSTDASAAAIFVRGVVPQSLAEKLPNDVLGSDLPNKEVKNPQVVELPAKDIRENPTDVPVRPIKTKIDEYTRQELLDMPQAQFDFLAGTDPQKMDPEILKIAYYRRATSSKE
jgi:hypothetical protein